MPYVFTLECNLWLLIKDPWLVREFNGSNLNELKAAMYLTWLEKDVQCETRCSLIKTKQNYEQATFEPRENPRQKRGGGVGGYKYERKEKGAQKPTLPNATPPQLLPSYLMQLPHT